jgi:two-component system, cell cycle sensor histidine kinase and response regulator CckA
MTEVSVVELEEKILRLTERTKALERCEGRTNFALEAAGMGIWELDPDAQQLTWSGTIPAVFGLRQSEAPTTYADLLGLIHDDDRDKVQDTLLQAARSSSAFEVEFRVMRPDGRMHWIAGRARPLSGSDGKPPHFVGVVTDVSDRKLLEAQFHQAQKMEAVGQLAGGVAHDFNNLLTAIQGYSGFVLETLGPEDPRRADLEEVIAAGQRAATLTRQLLALSRMQSPQPTLLDLNTLVTGMEQLLRRLIGAQQIELVSLLTPALGAIRADRGQLEQVLMNLVINAKDAMPSGGRIEMATASATLDETAAAECQVQPGSYVTLAVTDTGIGMTEDIRRRLFEPFFTTKDQGKGTGLGLATVEGIVKQCGGFICVVSAPDHGATFTLYFPQISDQEAAGTGMTPEALTQGTETVLLVEDEEVIRILTRSMLERAGYSVFDASNPLHAAELFEKHMNIVKLLITEVNMRHSSGPELFEALSRQRPLLKVLYVSGYSNDEAVAQGQSRGTDFLQKPFTADALNRRVREVLDR